MVGLHNIMATHDQVPKKEKESTVVVLITDKLYFPKAKQTILDCRTRGQWSGDIVLITIDFDLNENMKDLYSIHSVRFPIIDKSVLLEKLHRHGRFPDCDGREFTKLNQWEKLHVFDDYFRQWSRVIYFDAGLRVFDSIEENLVKLDYKNAILAPKDTGNFKTIPTPFKNQISFHDEELISEIEKDFGNELFESEYFLNCIWIYDTAILDICNKAELIDTMNKYPVCKTNEMTVMNLLFHFKYNLWREFPKKASNEKWLFDWSELNCPTYSTWRDYCFIKYPVSIPFHDKL
jgi:hypothetical protein